MSPGTAAAIVDVWRSLDSTMARTFVALVDAIPEPDEKTAAVAGLCRGLPRQHAEVVELIRRTGETISTAEKAGDHVQVWDPLDFLTERPTDADR